MTACASCENTADIGDNRGNRPLGGEPILLGDVWVWGNSDMLAEGVR